MSSDTAFATKAAEIILQADCIVIAAGAGMGVDSGLPDFRGTEGFWRAYPALRAAGLDFISVASPRTFRDDPTLAWGFYGHRLALYRDAPEAQAAKASGDSIFRAFMLEVLPKAPKATRAVASDLITTTLSTVGKEFSETPRTASEVKVYADAMARMFCAYIRDLDKS